ncbi:hypothetical protein Nepgr_006576 [Nepenthes gracilis]|uniref:Uncharacterized protein n=1 Tax=Nepenthes gracilis TaxID=150966 RepID=A0AAD3S5H3_NEPGR|nr:hypothetical protein Nepgr_006576 [Nepenthes gracilis]
MPFVDVGVCIAGGVLGFDGIAGTGLNPDLSTWWDFEVVIDYALSGLLCGVLIQLVPFACLLLGLPNVLLKPWLQFLY